MQDTDEGSRSPLSRAGYGETVFRSVGWPVTRWFFVRVWLAYAFVAATVLFVIDWSFWRDPFVVGFVILFPMLVPVMMTRSPKGKILVTHEGITLKASRTASYSWADIASLRLTSMSERGRAAVLLYRFFGLDVDKRFVEMKLRRSVRFNPISENSSTRGLGIPTGLLRAAHLYPDDPLALLTAAEVHVRPGVHG